MRRSVIAAIVFIASLVTPALAQSSGTFTATGSMTIARFGAAAALLPNGQVLVAGGTNNSALSTAELYTPSTGTWAKTGSMKTLSGSIALAVLQTGQVLATGEFDSTGNGAAELFDPASGKWTATGSMSNVSPGTVTLLSNGQVLGAGGADAKGNTVRTAELYTPATGTWTKTGDMTTLRSDARAVLLQNGKVLVAGGINSTTLNLTSAELYDPATGKWAETGSMPTTGGDGLTATLLAGTGCGTNCGKVLVFESAASTAGLYDPASGQWSAVSFGVSGRPSDVVATSLFVPQCVTTCDSNVLFTGGIAYEPRPTHTLAEGALFDPATGAAGGGTSMLIARYGHTATLLGNGQVLVAGGNKIGGTGGSAGLSEAELYTP
jgi:hypothetical protein